VAKLLRGNISREQRAGEVREIRWVFRRRGGDAERQDKLKN
jgi:hypothetical protein